MRSAASIIAEKFYKEGVKWGDAVAWATKRMGVAQCPPCKARQEILNHVRMNGWLNTIKAIKETLK